MISVSFDLAITVGELAKQFSFCFLIWQTLVSEFFEECSYMFVFCSICVSMIFFKLCCYLLTIQSLQSQPQSRISRGKGTQGEVWETPDTKILTYYLVVSKAQGSVTKICHLAPCSMIFFFFFPEASQMLAVSMKEDSEWGEPATSVILKP